jgi:hypothetical protein
LVSLATKDKRSEQAKAKDDRPRPQPAGKTTVDTVSAVRRRLGEDAPKQPEGPIRQWRLVTLGGAFVAIALVALLVGRGLRPGGESSAASKAAGAPAAPGGSPSARAAVPTTMAPGAATPPVARPAKDSPQLEEARQMVARGQVDQALALLNQLRISEPENPDIPYLQAVVFFENRRWSDGLAAAQLAVRKDPALKSDPDLIKGAIRSLANDRGYERSQAFLRSLGQPATPFIREAAQRDRDPRVRDRAADLLNSGRGWGHSSSGSSSSMFRR